MHETSQNKLVSLIPKLAIEHYYDDGTPLYYTRDGRAGSQFKAKRVADEFADYCEWYYDENPEAEDKSVMDFIREYLSNHPLVTDEERKWAPQAAREVEAWIGTSLEQASSKHLSYFETQRNLYMKGGYDSIVNWTAQTLREKDIIQLGQNVSRIDWNDNRDPVTVHTTTKDGTSHTFIADAVIVTVPLGALKHGMIDFSPKLPKQLSSGIEKLSYGALGKVFIEFESVFWSKDNDQLIYYPTPSTSAIDESSVFSYMTVTSNNWIMSGTKELSIQIVEPLTQRIEAMTSQSEIYAFFEPLFKLFRTEPHKDLPAVVNLETTHWTQDRFAGFGTYTSDKTGDEPEIWMEALASRKDKRLQFAGEHCTLTGNGCVHGAFATGETAAVNVLGSLGVKHNGGDAWSLTPSKRRSF
jgi:polyamine oxidase